VMFSGTLKTFKDVNIAKLSHKWILATPKATTRRPSSN